MKPVLILVAGGSAAGKTTIVNEVINGLKSNSDKCIHLFHDDYYNDNSLKTMEEREAINYDNPKSLDNDLVLEQINCLLEGKSIEKPVYDFCTHNRKKEKEHVEPKDIIILDGILVLSDSRLRKLSSMNIYIDADEDIRFIRRMQRDTKERGRTIESVIKQYLTSVKPSYQKYIEPSKKYADLIINNNENYKQSSLILSKILKDYIL